MLRNTINATIIEYTESLLGILYLLAVVKNLIWFIKPLKDREEYSLLITWFDDKKEHLQEQCIWVAGKVFPWWRRWRPKKEKPKNEEPKNEGRRASISNFWGKAVQAVIRMINGVGENETSTDRRFLVRDESKMNGPNGAQKQESDVRFSIPEKEE